MFLVNRLSPNLLLSFDFVCLITGVELRGRLVARHCSGSKACSCVAVVKADKGVGNGRSGGN